VKPGFHQDKVNSRLMKHWGKMNINSGRVFVPLCGKSIDMAWIAQSGFNVLGIEFSEIACRDFFEEKCLTFEESADSRFRYFKGVDIELWQGDFFSLLPEDLAGVGVVYDRASLIALPAPMRIDYANHLANILQPESKIFLISMDYDEWKMKGPPFSVAEEEVNKLFSKEFSIELITHSSGPDIVGNLRDRGLDTLNEKIYILERK